MGAVEPTEGDATLLASAPGASGDDHTEQSHLLGHTTEEQSLAALQHQAATVLHEMQPVPLGVEEAEHVVAHVMAAPAALAVQQRAVVAWRLGWHQVGWSVSGGVWSVVRSGLCVRHCSFLGVSLQYLSSVSLFSISLQ